MSEDEEVEAEETYDPDAPPERQPNEGLFQPTKSIAIQSQADAVAKLGKDAAERIQKYMDAGKRKYPVWYVEAKGIDAIREDGTDFIISDLLALVDKNGKWQTEGSAPDAYAKAYRDHGLTISYTKVGQPNSAIGRVFFMREHDIKLGKRGKFTKGVSLWPEELKPADFTYTGEVRKVPLPSTDDDEHRPEASPNGALTGDELVAVLRELAVGKTNSQLFEAVERSAELKGTGRVFGEPLMEAAAEDKLGDILVKNGVVGLAEDGTFQAPQPVSA